MKYRLLSSIYYEDLLEYENTYKKRYESESSYRYSFSIASNKAFLVINNNILNLITDILKLDKMLTLKINYLPNIALKQYSKKCIIDEIKMTNDIEGVISTRKEITEILEDFSGKKKGTRLYGLVKKYELLTQEDIDLNNCNDIRYIFDELVLNQVSAEDSQNIPDGEIFRKDSVYIQNKTGKTIHTGINPESKIIETLTNCLDMLKNENYNKLVSIAVFHYMFGYIHPFYDGNGRVSRFISSYLLSKELNPLISYKLSHTIKKNLDAYYKNFRIVNDEKNKGELTSFVEYFLGVLLDSLKDSMEYLNEKINRLNYFEKQLDSLYASQDIDTRELDILYILIQNTLFGEHSISVNELFDVTDLGLSKIRTSLKTLESLGFVNSMKNGKRLVYEANLENLEK